MHCAADDNKGFRGGGGNGESVEFGSIVATKLTVLNLNLVGDFLAARTAAEAG